MKLSIFTTAGYNGITDQSLRHVNFENAMDCYTDLADEVILMNGAPDSFLIGYREKLKVLDHDWHQEFDWPFIGQQFQRGYEAATGDWVIHADLDFIFHERDFKAIREVMEKHPNQPALSFWKYQFILPDRYNLKSRLVIAVNKGVYGDRIKFDSGGDLCQPSLDGEEIKPDFVQEARIPFYNYEKMAKTSDEIMADCGRMDRAYNRHFNDWQLSTDGTGTDESCFDGYIKLLKGRFKKPSEHIKIDDHPKYMQRTIRLLSPDQFGYNGLRLLGGDSDYTTYKVTNA